MTPLSAKFPEEISWSFKYFFLKLDIKKKNETNIFILNICGQKLTIRLGLLMLIRRVFR